MPLHRRIPKRGFHNPCSKEFAVVNVEMLERFCRRRNRHAGIDSRSVGIVHAKRDGASRFWATAN